MKIALVILQADATRGGAEGYTVRLAQTLHARGHEVSLLAESFGADLPSIERFVIHSAAPTRLRRYVRFLDHLDEHLSAHRYDVVHAMLPVRRCDVYHAHAGLAVEAVDRGHLRYNNPLRRRLARLGTSFNRKRQRFAAVETQLLHGPRPPVLLCLTEQMRQSALRYFPRAHPQQIVTLFYGIDLNRFNPEAIGEHRADVRSRLGLDQRQVVALIVAQDFERKGVGEAIRAVARANDPRLALLVVGRDSPRAYQRLARSLGIESRVVFAGAMRDVENAYAAADFLVFPSRVEPCGLVVLEAMAMGLPVIVARTVGAHEALSDAREGFVVDDPRDVDGLARAAASLLDDSQRRGMGEAARRRGQLYSEAVHLENLMRIYQRVRSGATATIGAGR